MKKIHALLIFLMFITLLIPKVKAGLFDNLFSNSVRDNIIVIIGGG